MGLQIAKRLAAAGAKVALSFAQSIDHSFQVGHPEPHSRGREGVPWWGAGLFVGFARSLFGLARSPWGKGGEGADRLGGDNIADDSWY